MGEVIAHPTMQGRPIPDRLVRDVLAGRCRSDWTMHEYLVAARELLDAITASQWAYDALCTAAGIDPDELLRTHRCPGGGGAA